MKTVRAVLSVDGLESEVFGSGNITWWAALLGEVIEGVVMLLAVMAFLYLRRNSFSAKVDSSGGPARAVAYRRMRSGLLSSFSTAAAILPISVSTLALASAFLLSSPFGPTGYQRGMLRRRKNWAIPPGVPVHSPIQSSGAHSGIRDGGDPIQSDQNK